MSDQSSSPIDPNQKRIGQWDVLPRSVKQRHIEAWIIYSGLEANIPNGKTEVMAYWAYDSKKLYLWNQSTSTWNYVSFT